MYEIRDASGTAGRKKSQVALYLAQQSPSRGSAENLDEEKFRRKGKVAALERIASCRRARGMLGCLTASKLSRTYRGLLWVTRHYPGEGCPAEGGGHLDISHPRLFQRPATEMLQTQTDTSYHPALSLADITRLTPQATLFVITAYSI